MMMWQHACTPGSTLNTFHTIVHAHPLLAHPLLAQAWRLEPLPHLQYDKQVTVRLASNVFYSGLVKRNVMMHQLFPAHYMMFT